MASSFNYWKMDRQNIKIWTDLFRLWWHNFPLFPHFAVSLTVSPAAVLNEYEIEVEEWLSIIFGVNNKLIYIEYAISTNAKWLQHLVVHNIRSKNMFTTYDEIHIYVVLNVYAAHDIQLATINPFTIFSTHIEGENEWDYAECTYNNRRTSPCWYYKSSIFSMYFAFYPHVRRLRENEVRTTQI